MRPIYKKAVPFNPNFVCLKCGNDDTEMTYEYDNGFFGWGAWETLIIDCSKCGATSDMQTKEQTECNKLKTVPKKF